MDGGNNWTFDSTSNNWYSSYGPANNEVYYTEPQDLTKHIELPCSLPEPQSDPYLMREITYSRDQQYVEEITGPSLTNQHASSMAIDKLNLNDISHCEFENIPTDYPVGSPDGTCEIPNNDNENIADNGYIDDRLFDFGSMVEWVGGNQVTPTLINDYNDGQCNSYVPYTHCDTNSIEETLHYIPSEPSVVKNFNAENITEVDELAQRDMYLEMQKYPSSNQYKRNQVRNYGTAIDVRQSRFERSCYDDRRSTFDHIEPAYFDDSHDHLYDIQYQTNQGNQCTESPQLPLDLTEDVGSMLQVGESQDSRLFTPDTVASPEVDSCMTPPPAVYKCSVCEELFEKENDMKKHKRVHKPKLKCRECPRYLVDSTRLKMHMRIHTGEKPWICDICGKEFSRNNNYVEHMHKHNGSKPYKCSYCDAKFRLSSTRKTHEYTHTGVKPFQCKHCEAKFTQVAALKRHYATHSNDRPFQCDICSKSLRTQGDLQRHLKGHKNMVACETCGESFPSNKKLIVHRMTHNEGSHPYECDLCKGKFKTWKSLRQHKQRFHVSNKFECSICNRKFNQKVHLTSHAKQHKTDVISDVLSHHVCIECGKKYADAWEAEKCCDYQSSLSSKSVPEVHVGTHVGVPSTVPPARLLTEVLENFDRCEGYLSNPS